jgi:methyl-accepting chemotaxis protein
LQQSYKAWSASIDELEILLQKRIQTLKTHRANSILYSGLALLLTILVSIYIGYTISSSIKIIINAIRNLKTAADSSSEFSNNLNREHLT